MRSYFARLAARASLQPPSPPVSRSSKLFDPFEQVAGPELPLSPAAPPTAPPSPETARPAGGARDVDFTGPPAEAAPAVSIPPSVGPKREAARPTPPSPGAAEPASEGRPEPVEARFEPRKGAPRREEPPAGVQGAVEEELRRAPETPPAGPEDGESEPESEMRLDEMQRRHAELLRRADAFMSGLLERRPSSEPAGDAGKQPEARPIEVSRSAERSERLQPRQAPVAPAVNAEEPPSLVIGRLTVEVTPPAPATPQPPRERIVVVRGPGSGGRSGPPTSRRFGLSQF